MSAVNLISSIKTRVSTVLGSNYSEISYANTIEKNSFNGNFLRYGVLAKSQTEVDSVTKYSTINQVFELILVDSFINTAMSDASEQSKAPILQDKAFQIYRDLVSTKCGLPGTVLIVNEFNTFDPETLDDKVVVVRAQFTVRYRQSI